MFKNRFFLIFLVLGLFVVLTLYLYSADFGAAFLVSPEITAQTDEESMQLNESTPRLCNFIHIKGRDGIRALKCVTPSKDPLLR